MGARAQPGGVGRTAAFRPRWSWRTELRVALLGCVIALAARLVYRTLRIELHDDAAALATRRAGGQIIAAFWHDGIPLMPLMVTRLGWPGRVTALLSWHRDAEIAARALGRLGIASVHGSSTRGWMSGLRGLLAARARGDDLAIVPDGPRGPRHEAKEGVVQLARTTGLPVIAFGLAAWPARRLGSWDRMQVPRWRARVAIVTRGPIRVDRDGAMGDALAAVQAALAEATAAAAHAVGAPP